MTIAEMLEQSGVLTLLGMGIVFGFLVVLIICVSLVGKVIHALGVDKDVTAPATTGTSPGGGAGAGNAAVTAAISAAVNEYRKTANP
ncbi:MAG: OadG family protein [Spirochaetaceae bacterium]|jgi:oxaloacetate decarboxylase gamma subunit|nr:OadG family protein [Spirochaetaceae bacterium]